MEIGSAANGLRRVGGTYAAQFMRQLGEATTAAKMKGDKLRPSEFEIAIPGTSAAATAEAGAPRFEDLGPDHPMSILNEFDTNQDGKIDFRENMRMAFEFSNPLDIGNAGDLGGQGALMRTFDDLEDLEEYLGSVFDGVFSKEESEALFAKLDKDNDGKVSESEMEKALEEIEHEAALRLELQNRRDDRVGLSSQAEALSNDPEMKTAVREYRSSQA